ncbi:hypothetical protein E2320_019972, partial [Naja naja]
EKDTQRRQKAIDKRIAKAEKEVEQKRGKASLERKWLKFPMLYLLSKGNWVFADKQLMPAEGQWEPLPKQRKAAPETTFTPTVAGLCPRESQRPEIMGQMKILISEALTQAIAAGLQQGCQAAP